MRPARVIALVGLVAGVIVIAAAITRGSDEPSPSRDAGAAQAHAVRAGCVDRAEGDYSAANDANATTIGSVTWPFIRSNFRQLISGELGPPPGTDYPYKYYPVKALAFVKAGAPVTLSVPPSQRRYLGLAYGHDSIPAEGVWEVTLVACRRSTSAASQARECDWEPRKACRTGRTQFAGTIHVDFDRAPQQGNCSELIVREDGRRPVRDLLFQRSPGSC